MIPSYHPGLEDSLQAALYPHHHVTSLDPRTDERSCFTFPRMFFKMPRVVPNQRERFETEEIFTRNTKDMEVRNV